MKLLWFRWRSIAWVWKGTEHIVWPFRNGRKHYSQPYLPPKVVSGD